MNESENIYQVETLKEEILFLKQQISELHAERVELYEILKNHFNDQYILEETRDNEKLKNLLESNSQYKVLINSMDEGYCVIEMQIDPSKPLDYRFIEVNHAFERQSTLENATGKWMRELRPDHEEYWFEIYRDVALTGKPKRFEQGGRALENRWFSVYAFRIDPPKKYRVAILFNDITEHKKAQSALLESEVRFRTLFETMQQGVIYFDSMEKVILANSAAESILGLSYEQMQNEKKLGSHWLIIQEDKINFSSHNNPVTIALHTGSVIKDILMGVYYPPTGDYKWIIVTATPQFKDKEPEPYQAFITFIDITERKQMEESLRLKNEELTKAKEKAEESDKLKTAFLTSLSHEIRTPMNGIIGFINLLKTPDLSQETQQKYIEVIQMSGKRMLDILNDLVDISRIQTGQVKTKTTKTNILEIMNEQYELFSPDAKLRSIYLKCSTQVSKDTYITTDKLLLTQILSKLIQNALKFTDNGGYVEFGCSITNGIEMRFYVKDNGIGIHKELHKQIFERFSQGDYRQIHEGIGLGLSIAKAFVEMLNGNIYLDSEPGKGSTFFFTIPLIFRSR